MKKELWYMYNIAELEVVILLQIKTILLERDVPDLLKKNWENNSV